MNKFLFPVLVILGFSCSNEKQDSFTVNGTIKNSNATMVYLEENPIDAQPVIVDSAKPGADGKFTMEAIVKEESMFSLRSNTGEYPFALFVNDTKSITVDADPSNTESPYSVKGSDASQAMLDFDRMLGEKLEVHVRLMKEIDSLGKITGIPAGEKKIIDSITNLRFAEYEANMLALKNQAKEFLDNSKSPVLGLYALGSFQTRATQYGMRGFSQTEVSEIINQAAGKFPNHTALQEQKKKLRPAAAPDFTLPDTNGNPVSLSSFRGKWVLLDFWASWCAPCRKENPNIVAAYHQFKDKNFTILGISLDKEKNAWLQAIQDDSLTWNHVSDLQFWNSQAATLYGVRSIPYNVLLDPSGNIVADNLHGQELQRTLGRYLR